MDPERLGHPSGKTQFERATAGSCQLIGRDDTSRANQKVGRDTARHATSKHQVFGRSLALRQIFGLERRRDIVTLHQTHAVRIASRRHAGEQTYKTVEILGVEHARGGTTQAQVAPSGPVGNVMGALMAVERIACHLIG